MKTTLTVVLIALAALLCACPPEGPVCSAGLSRCGTGCADFKSDRRNCGACGKSCQALENCKAGVCTCETATKACGGKCVVLDTDPANCGECGTVCPTDQPFCEGGHCKATCAAGNVCVATCTDFNTDKFNCGECGVHCDQAQTCHQGMCSYDLVAACSWTGQMIGYEASTEVAGPLTQVGVGPAALAQYHDIALVLDGNDRFLREARLTSVNGVPFAVYPDKPKLGAAANHAVVDQPYVYVVNALGNTLQILESNGVPFDAGAPDAGPADAGSDAGVVDSGVVDSGVADAGNNDAGIDDGGGSDAGFAPGPEWIHSPLDGGHYPNGLGLVTIAELNFGPNTSPEAIAKIGNALYVPLWGGAFDPGPGQKVIKVDITDRRNPQISATYDLSTLDLKTFDGGTSTPRPFAIVVHQGKLYVPLNNLDSKGFSPGGPGLLATIDPASGAVGEVALGPDCLNPVWAESDGTRLYVSCAGAAQLDVNYNVVSVDKAGLVMLLPDGGSSTWKAHCTTGADGGGCPPTLPSRFAIVGGRVYLGDQQDGRIFVLDTAGDSLTERDGGPIHACPIGNFGQGNVSDLMAVP